MIFVPHFANLTLPLTALIEKNVQFRWSEAANAAFVDLKLRLASRPILRPPNYALPFSLTVDASETCLGAILFQVVGNVEHPISYSTVEKEALALVTSVRSFSPYFDAAPVTVWTDHLSPRYMETMSNHNSKLMRGSLEFQCYCLDVKHRPGKLNLLPDLLSKPASA